MRYLKPYQLFESFSDEVRDDIIDIFAELQDNGFLVLVDASPYHSGFITILLPNDKLFTLDSEIVQSILRLIDYLRMNKLYLNELTIKYPTHWNLPASDITEEGIFIKGELELKTDSDSKIRQIKIKYSKFDIVFGEGIEYMKHLRKFNESKFEDSFINQYYKILPELNDILLPFDDSGIKYSIYKYADDNIGEVNIYVEDKVEEYVDNALEVSKKFFTWKEIKEEMLHVISFMNSEGIGFSKLEIQQIVDNEFHYIEIYDESEIEELEDELKFTKFEILFCKIP